MGARYQHGPGVFKLDWILSEPVPWINADVRRAGTVHVGGGLDEMMASERAATRARSPPALRPRRPADRGRPQPCARGRHTFWAYVHVPQGSDVDMTDAIENQIERFAPGFRDTVADRAYRVAMQQRNPSDLGGEISNGKATLRQMLARPVPRWNTYKTPLKGVYLSSAATPPGPAVHGMSGENAAQVALRDVFGVRHVPPLRPAAG